MKKSKIYTRSGDLGETGLVSGSRTSKSDLRIDLYGELDELNSRVGMSCAYLQGKNYESVIVTLNIIQSLIFDLGSNLACEHENRNKYNLPQLPHSSIETLELEMDRLDDKLTPLKNFILPGGSIAAASLHLCRTGARGVERKLIHYHQVTKEDLPVNSIVFLNRLSDYFFVLARYVNNQEGCSETQWRPSV